MSNTPRLNLPYIVAAQAQKEVTHNEALIALDALTQLVIEDRDLAAPPASPQEGQIWLVASAASGAWVGRDGELAQYDGGVWRFYTAFADLRGWLRDEAIPLRFDGSVWQERGVANLGPASAAISDPSGGSVIDVEARSAITTILTALRNHGIIAT